jgi:FKBP-type peptidyl-prolyl cis-trans isomerase SlyD
MNISKHHVVTVSYHLLVPGENGEQSFEKTTADQPLVFLFGMGQLLPEFEQNLQGKAVGDTFDFYIAPENAYGLYQDNHVVELPVDIFFDEQGKLDGSLTVGKRVPMMDNQGNRLVGTILHMGLETIRMDFNHPLAGKQLHFTGEVLEVRAATDEELDHGHVHGPGGHQH